MPSDYERERGERFHSKGMVTGRAADALQPGEYPFLINVRGNSRSELTTRAGFTQQFSTTATSNVTNINSYGSGRFLAKTNTNVYLDNGAIVDSGYGPAGASMLPFRPNQSPQPWIYIGDEFQYRKLSFPVSNVVTAQNVGIAEPQAPPEIYNDAVQLGSLGGLEFLFPTQPWGNSGTAGGVTIGVPSGRSTDTIVAVFPDPVSGGTYYTIQTAGGVAYSKEEIVWPDSAFGNAGRIVDVFTPIPTGINIIAIQYFSGGTGRCVVVPDLQAPGPGIAGESIYSQGVLANLRRGALVQIGAEVCYVLDVEHGPLPGNISFTTTTSINHTAAETLSGVPAIRCFISPGTGLTPGSALNSGDWTFSSGAGIGTIQVPSWTNFFTGLGASFQPDDYLHFSVLVDDLTRLTELKIIFNVTAGAYTGFDQDAFYYTVRPSDIQAGVANTLTQLGVTQLFAQRELIEQETGVTASAQTLPGSNVWSEIQIPIRQLTRIGNDQTRTINDAHGIQFLVNATNTVNIGISSVGAHGGGQIDVGTVGSPYQYRFRGRSSVTGARSNPSPPTRYGVSPVREVVQVILPNPADPQIDLWDIFRIGGTLDSYRLVGTVPGIASRFTDNVSDIAVQQSEHLPFDDLQPWPTIDLPLSVPVGVTVVGYVVTFSLTAGDSHLATISRYLPGNIVKLGQYAYTIYTRPTVIGTAVTMQLVENAGYSVGGSLYIYEPLMANQPIPYLWGPSAEGGTIFGVGDSNRPGNVYFAKNFNPDSAPDKYNIELSPPSEPLTGGCLLNGESFAFTASRCWALRPSFGGINHYTPRQVPTGAGAVCHFAITTDGKHIYFVAKDGIYATSGGPGQLLTTRENIWTLFPHEGQFGEPWTYAGHTISPPDYNLALGFRLCYANGFLYFDYQGKDGNFYTLVYDINAGAWYTDKTQSFHITTRYALPQKDTSGTVLVLAGNNDGRVLRETAGVSDNSFPILGTVATRELCPDDRAFSWFGDIGLDLKPSLAFPTTAQGYSLGAALTSPSSFTSANRLPLSVVDIGGGQTLKSLGLVLEWSQAYVSGETSPVVLYAWQPSWVPKPETSDTRFTDWHPRPAQGNFFWQGFLIEADSGNVAKAFQVRDADTLTVQEAFTGTWNGQEQMAFSFTQPFIAHTVRLEPTGSNPWRLFNIEWIKVPYPEAALHWTTEGTSHGNRGFQHLYMGQMAYIATQQVTITLRFDQGPPITITIPATGARLDPVKFQFKIPPNKFKVVSYDADSTAPFYLWVSDCEFWCSAWGSVGGYSMMRPVQYDIIRPFGGMSESPRALV